MCSFGINIQSAHALAGVESVDGMATVLLISLMNSFNKNDAVFSQECYAKLGPVS